MARYQMLVAKNVGGADDQIREALRLSPNDPELLSTAAAIERAAGKWDVALQHLQLARRLDPKSATVAGELHRTLTTMRRYQEAIAAGREAMALAPENIGVVEWQVMNYLGQGDLAGARKVMAEVPPVVAQPALVAYLSLYNDLFWALDDAQQQLALRLPASAYFDDPTAWGVVKMQIWWMRGDRDKARAYADTAKTAFIAQLKAAPDDPQLHAIHGLTLAYLGQKDQAIAEGKRSLELMPISKDAANGAYDQHLMARIYLLVGEPEKALDMLEPLLQIPYFISPGWLRIDPNFAPLKGNPRFEKLIAGS
jgi:tetratricopeptide (TPR) repeat protein